MSALSALYGGVVRFRRSWYARRPQARLRLPRPVVSVGNLTVGGSGKTPVVAALAGVLTRLGHRPAILSRGYRRIDRSSPVVIVSDGTGPLTSVDESGDEPQMLAKEVTGVPVVVSVNRYLAGQLAIERFNATVLILDDGFQHVQVERAVDLVVVSAGDLAEKVLPSGRLREPLSAARVADAVLVYGDLMEAQRVARNAGVGTSFGVRTTYLPLRPVTGSMSPVPSGGRVLAVAGIAQPGRFFDALRQQGHDVVQETAFPDHHWFTAAELNEIERTAQRLQVALVITTAKDAVRLERATSSGNPAPGGPARVAASGVSRRADTGGALSVGRLTPWAVLPIQVQIEPAAEFDAWLKARV